MLYRIGSISPRLGDMLLIVYISVEAFEQSLEKGCIEATEVREHDV